MSAEENKLTYQFNTEKAMAAAKDYALSTGMECLLLYPKEGSIANPCQGMIHDQLCYCLNNEIAKTCVNTHYEGMLQAKSAGKPQSYYCPMGLLHWASPIIVDGQIEAAFIAGHTFLNESKKELAGLKSLTTKHAKLLEDYPMLKESLQQSPVVNDDRLQSLKNMLDVVARSFSDKKLSEATFRTMRQVLERNDKESAAADIPWQALLDSIEQKDPVATEQALKEVIAAIDTVTDPQPIRAALGQLILSMYDKSLEEDSQSFLCERYLNAINDLEQQDTVADISLWAQRNLRSLLEAGSLVPGIKNADMIYAALQYINDHYSEKFSLQDIADYVHFSAPYFSKVFKKEMDTTFTKYLTTLRVEKSKELLRNTDHPLAVIPALVGFEEQSYFTRVFRTATGISPGKYREQNTI